MSGPLPGDGSGSAAKKSYADVLATSSFQRQGPQISATSVVVPKSTLSKGELGKDLAVFEEMEKERRNYAEEEVKKMCQELNIGFHHYDPKLERDEGEKLKKILEIGKIPFDRIPTSISIGAMPLNKNFETLELRKKSFEAYKVFGNYKSTEKLAEAGFFFVEGRIRYRSFVICYNCGARTSFDEYGTPYGVFSHSKLCNIVPNEISEEMVSTDNLKRIHYSKLDIALMNNSEKKATPEEEELVKAYRGPLEAEAEKETTDDDGILVVCMMCNGLVGACFMRCGHMVCCVSCAKCCKVCCFCQGEIMAMFPVFFF